METKSDRQLKLGFKPQREIVYNKHLPYADAVDEEEELLAVIF